MNKIKFIIFMIAAVLLSAGFTLISKDNNFYGATEAYRVYLNGNSMGLVKSDKELYDYINTAQEALKRAYNVDKIYAPEGLEVKKEMTYSNLITPTKEIYDKIVKNNAFTIEGYAITMTKKDIESETNDSGKKDTYVEKTTIYVLDLDMFKRSVDSVVKSFVGSEAYEKYLNNSQTKITTTGVVIENVYIEDDFVIKKTLIPTNKSVFTNEDELTAYLLFGTTEKQKKYTVKNGDTIESIANANKISSEEFLIANPDITNEDALLYKGQEVVIGMINPMFVVVEEVHSVQNEQVLYSTESRHNNSLYIGMVKIIREGSMGESRVTKKIKYSNGNITNVRQINNEVIKEPVSRIIEKGGKTTYVVGDTGIWKWPTRIPYTISGRQGWRTHYVNGKLYSGYHYGIDITGCGGKNSPIYAAQAGTIEFTGWKGAYGQMIIINHNNGYKTKYAHLNKIYVQKGQGVQMGDVIGGMGTTGRSSGVHLHFEAWYKNQLLNPFDLYR